MFQNHERTQRNRVVPSAIFALFAVSMWVASSTAQTVKVMPAEDVNRMAEDAWQKLTLDESFAGDFSALDQFLKRHSDAVISSDAFALRFTLVQSSGCIGQYNEFIRLYPGRLAVPMAVQEVFEKYERVGTAGAYIDFMRRYPGTVQAELARLSLHRITYELAARIDRLEDYEGFIRLFPDAAQIGRVKVLALEKRNQHEKAWLDKSPEMDQVAREARANRLAVEMGRALTAANQATSTGERALYFTRAERIMTVLTEYYPDCRGALQVREEARHQELLKKLEAIDATLKRNHQQLLDHISLEFSELRKSIESGLDAILAENREARSVFETHLKAIDTSTRRIHTELVGISAQLERITGQLDNLTQQIHETNAKLDGIRKDLSRQHEAFQNFAIAFDRYASSKPTDLLADLSLDQVASNLISRMTGPSTPASASSLNMLVGTQGGQLQESLHANRGGFQPVKALQREGFRVMGNWMAEGGEAAWQQAISSAPGLLAEVVGYSISAIPVAGEYLAVPAADLTHRLAENMVDDLRSLTPEEIQRYSKIAEKQIKGTGKLVTASLQACVVDGKAREQSLNEKILRHEPGDHSAFIHQYF